jgi:preprotein translocase subunit SecG
LTKIEVLMYALLLTIFILVSLLMIITILLQSSKGGGLAGAFGGGGMGTVFGGRGAATFLSKVTAVLATLFMLLSLVLGLMISASAENQGLVEQARQERSASPATILPSVPGTEAVSPEPQPAPPADQPAQQK